MRYSDIKERHIYNVDFEPVKQSEFNKIHLAIVLKKNNDNKTCIVAPLTSKENGDTFNKYNLGNLLCLPKNMQEANSFMVYNQIRTLNHSRFWSLKDDEHKSMDCEVQDNMFDLVISLCGNELFTSLSLEQQVKYYSNEYKKKSSMLLTDIAYKILKIVKLDSKGNELTLLQLQNKIRDILKVDFNYEEYISQKDKDNRIYDIINYCRHNNILSKDLDVAIDIKIKNIEENSKSILTK